MLKRDNHLRHTAEKYMYPRELQPKPRGNDNILVDTYKLPRRSIMMEARRRTNVVKRAMPTSHTQNTIAQPCI